MGQDQISKYCACWSHVDYSADPQDPRFSFSFEFLDVVCSTVRIHATFRPRSSEQNLFQDRDRNNWGGPLEPGLYRQIDVLSSYQTCIRIRPESHPQGPGLQVLGGTREPEDVSVTGIRISDSAGTTNWLSEHRWVVVARLVYSLVVMALLFGALGISTARSRRPPAQSPGG